MLPLNVHFMSLLLVNVFKRNSLHSIKQLYVLIRQAVLTACCSIINLDFKKIITDFYYHMLQTFTAYLTVLCFPCREY